MSIPFTGWRVWYRLARNTYQRLVNRRHWRERARLREFLRPFVPREGLVFDVGAFRGHYTETMWELGGRVVAVEPNPQLAAEIRRHFPGIVIEERALGSEGGTATLRVGRYGGHSTLSDQWAATFAQRFTHEIEVEVTTLDALIARHGLPMFLKVDVEGYEPEVFGGLSEPVPALSFEYQCALPEIAGRAIARVEHLGDYDFAIARANEYEFMTGWISAREVTMVLRGLAREQPASYGDIYARATHSRS